MADNRLSTFLPNRSVMGAKMLQRPAEPYLRQQAPEVYGALSGMMGTAPDQQGSVLDPNTARARAGAEIGFPLGTALQMMPFAKPAAAGVKALGPTAGRMAEGYLQRQGLMPSIVPNSSKQFNVVNRDASEIFGAGAERLRYTDPASGGSIEVLKRPDNTASVLSLEVPKSFRGKGIGESLQAKVLQDFPQMQGQVSSKAAAKTAYRLGRRPPNQPNASLDDVYKIMDENSSVNLVSPQMQRSFSPTFQYPQQAALDLAQQRAALPAEQGGLGLPVGNTAEQRAAAMKFENRGFHETEGSNIENGLLNFDVKRVGAAASDEQTPYAMFIKPHGQSIGIAKKNPAQMPLMVKSNLTDENIMQAFGNREELQQYLNQYPDIQKATEAVSDLDKKMANYMGEIQKKADDLYAQGKTEQGDKLLDSLNVDSNLMKEFDLRMNELSAISKEKITDLFKSKGIGTLGLSNDAGAFGRKTITEAVLNPAENVRSRFAAFDPFRKTAATAAAFGVAAPDLLAAQPKQQPGQNSLNSFIR